MTHEISHRACASGQVGTSQMTTRPLLDRHPADGSLTVRATDTAALVLTVRTLGGRRQSVTLDVDDAQALRDVLDDWLRRMDLRAALRAGAPAMLAAEAAASVRLSRDPEVQTYSLDTDTEGAS